MKVPGNGDAPESATQKLAITRNAGITITDAPIYSMIAVK